MLLGWCGSRFKGKQGGGRIGSRCLPWWLTDGVLVAMQVHGGGDNVWNNIIVKLKCGTTITVHRQVFHHQCPHPQGHLLRHL